MVLISDGSTHVKGEEREAMKKIVIISIFLVASVVGLFTVNYLMLGKPMKDVLKSDPRNSEIHITAHYKVLSNSICPCSRYERSF